VKNKKARNRDLNKNKRRSREVKTSLVIKIQKVILYLGQGRKGTSTVSYISPKQRGGKGNVIGLSEDNSPHT